MDFLRDRNVLRLYGQLGRGRSFGFRGRRDFGRVVRVLGGGKKFRLLALVERLFDLLFVRHLIVRCAFGNGVGNLLGRAHEFCGRLEGLAISRQLAIQKANRVVEDGAAQLGALLECGLLLLGEHFAQLGQCLSRGARDVLVRCGWLLGRRAYGKGGVLVRVKLVVLLHGLLALLVNYNCYPAN